MEDMKAYLYCLFWFQLPQRVVDTIAIRQKLLSQYDILQSRIKDLKEATENEVSLHYNSVLVSQLLSKLIVLCDLLFIGGCPLKVNNSVLHEVACNLTFC